MIEKDGLKFISPRVYGEYIGMLRGERPDGLVPVMLYIGALSMEIAGAPAVVTMIHREPHEQARLVRTMNEQREELGLPLLPPGTRSVHEYYRGVDFRHWIYTFHQRAEIARRTNARFNYGRGKLTLKYHALGTAGHLHGQISGTRPWRI